MSKLVNKLNIFSPEDSRDYNLDTVGVGLAESIPEEYMPEKRVPITNQFWSSSCVSHALATTMGYGEIAAGLEPNRYSCGRIYADRNGKNENIQGMYTRDAIKILKDEGDCVHHEFRWHMSDYQTVKRAYDRREEELNEKSAPYKIKSYVRLYGDEEIKTAILTYGAVIMAYPMYKSNDIYIEPPKDGEVSTGSHAITVIGWTKDHWILQNSWGELSGDGGLYYMSMKYPWREAWCVQVDTDSPRNPAPKCDYWNDLGHDAWEIFCGLVYWTKTGIKKLLEKIFKKSK